ncbi:hypothetical protein AAHB50_29340 [Bacillus toyonensis]
MQVIQNLELTDAELLPNKKAFLLWKAFLFRELLIRGSGELYLPVPVDQKQ